MNPQSWSPAMVMTHVPYFIVAAILILVVRRTRRLIERIAAQVEDAARGRS